MKHLIAGAAHLSKSAQIGGDYLRIAVSASAAGWHCFADADRQSGAFEPDGVTRANDPLLL